MPFVAASAQFLSGKYATATIGGPGSGSLILELACISWSVNPTAMMVEFINSLSGGHVLRESTFYDVDGTIDADWDFGNNAFSLTPTPPMPGENLTNLFLYLRQSGRQKYDGPYWTFGSVIVAGTPQNVSVTGKPVMRIPFRGNGSISMPGSGTANTSPTVY